MLDFTKELSLNKVIYNNRYESLFDPIENPLRDLDNISMIFEQAFPFKMNEANEEQNFPEYKKEIADKENLFNPEFNYKDQNDKVENKYLETSMVLDEFLHIQELMTTKSTGVLKLTSILLKPSMNSSNKVICLQNLRKRKFMLPLIKCSQSM